MKYLLAVLLAGLLSACSLGASSPSEQPLESIGQSESMAPSESAGMSASESPMASPSMSAAASAEVGMSCADAWDAVDTTGINSISDLETVASDVNQTFSDCQSLDEWVTQAQTVLPTLDLQELQTWATAQCSLDDTLSQTPVCMAINS